MGDEPGGRGGCRARARGMRHPSVTWSLTLPLWMAMAVAALWVAPGAAFLWTLPLLAAGILLLLTPPDSDPALRITSIVVLAVTATLWLRDTVELLRFMVAVFGRLPIVTPVSVYAGVMTGGGRDGRAAVHRGRGLARARCCGRRSSPRSACCRS